ncbi:hypothetical protein I5M32_11215 [Pedobacter sp. SD-b]|uniref:Uncharacterized protein n=1 Tax=Pedobacter segetis TaxID=2793069 RepID=A0ABS1BL98_9SPHI|nr:hypothetical protein [Pedobacter segetis]MBK0383526.1 hypothetical protein [Pedobacter segetis]
MGYINPICFLNKTETLDVAVKSLDTFKQFGVEDFRNVAGDIKSVQMVLEPNAAAAANAILARYWQTGVDPTLTEGIPVRAFDKIAVNSVLDVISFRIMAIDGLEHTLQIQYFNY